MVYFSEKINNFTFVASQISIGDFFLGKHKYFS